MDIADQALETRKTATVGDMLDALAYATPVDAYRTTKPESTDALGQLQENVEQAGSLVKELAPD